MNTKMIYKLELSSPQIFHPDGRFSHMFGSDGTDEGQFMEPCGVAVRNEQLYVCDHHNHRIQVSGSIFKGVRCS